MVFRRPVGAGRTQPLMGIKPGRRTTPVLNSGQKIIVVPNTERPTAGFGVGVIVQAGAGVFVKGTTTIRRGNSMTRPTHQPVRELSITRPHVRELLVNLI